MNTGLQPQYLATFSSRVGKTASRKIAEVKQLLAYSEEVDEPEEGEGDEKTATDKKDD